MKDLDGARVLLWGAQHNDVHALRECLEHRGLRVEEVDTFEELRAALRAQEVDLIVTRLCGCFQRPLDMLTWLRQIPSAPPVVVVTVAGDVDLYLEAMRRGAFDSVGLPLNDKELIRIVSSALEARHSVLSAGGARE
jgi:DNA-binding NtrC family response regulator